MTDAEALAPQIRRMVIQGWRVESQTEARAVMVKGSDPNHLLHFLLSMLTLGAWAILVWLPLWLFKHEQRLVLTGPSMIEPSSPPEREGRLGRHRDP